MSARRRRPAVAVAAGGVATALLATGCTSIKASGAALTQPGELRTCTHLPYPPFQQKQGEQIVGFDVDLVDLVAQELKVKQSIINTPFEGTESGQDFNTAKCDLAAAGMTITPERQKVMDFSEPYFDAKQALITRKGKPYRRIEDLKGKRFGYQKGTTGAEYAKKHGRGVRLVQYEDVGLLTTAVKTGQVEAAINDNGVLYAFTKDNPDVRTTAEFSTGEQYGFAVRTGNNALRKKVNRVLNEAKKDGRYARIYQKWFGVQPPKGDS